MTEQVEKPQPAQNLLRSILLWLTLSVIAALGILSIGGSFIGADRAREILAWRLAPFWMFLAALLVFSMGYTLAMMILAGISRSWSSAARLLPSLTMHLGVVLLLLGSMWNSPLGHDVAKKLFGGNKVPSGFIVLGEDEPGQAIVDNRGGAIGELPFELRLRDFSIEYYPPKGETWPIVAVEGMRGEHPQQRPVAWKSGQDVAIPGTDATLRVIEYIPHARSIYRGAKGRLEIITPDGKTTSIPAVAGQETTLEDPKARVHLDRVFSNFRVKVEGGSPRAVEAGGGEINPAVEVGIVIGDELFRRFVFEHGGMMGGPVGGIELRYVDNAIGAEADAKSDVPAARIAVSGAGQKAELWLIVRPGMEASAFSLREALGEGAADVDIILARPQTPVKSYKSDVEVVRDGKVAQHAVIEVNHPLLYGGYQFAQASYDTEGGRYTVLAVTSDSGMWLVYAGMALLTAGVLVWCWVVPLVRRLQRGRAAEMQTAGAHGD